MSSGAISEPSSGKKHVLILLGSLLQSISAEGGWDGEVLKSLSPTHPSRQAPVCDSLGTEGWGSVCLQHSIYKAEGFPVPPTK